MTSNIQKLIEQRPHLKDPFEFYAKWQRFQHEADEIMPANRTGLVPAESKAYPQNSAGPVFRSFAAALTCRRGRWRRSNRRCGPATSTSCGCPSVSFRHFPLPLPRESWPPSSFC